MIFKILSMLIISCLKLAYYYVLTIEVAWSILTFT